MEIIRPTDIMCDSCEKENLVVVKGWETDEALKCPSVGCGQYHYFIMGKVWCANTNIDHKHDNNWTAAYKNELKRALNIPVELIT